MCFAVLRPHILAYVDLHLTAKLLLAFASTMILSSKPHGTHDNILLPDVSGSLQTLNSKFHLLEIGLR
jgi:hypothetical protein